MAKEGWGEAWRGTFNVILTKTIRGGLLKQISPKTRIIYNFKNVLKYWKYCTITNIISVIVSII